MEVQEAFEKFCQLGGREEEDGEMGESSTQASAISQERKEMEIVDDESNEEVLRNNKIKHAIAIYLKQLSFGDLMEAIKLFLAKGIYPDVFNDSNPQERQAWRKRCALFRYDPQSMELFRIRKDKFSQKVKHVPVITNKDMQWAAISRVHDGITKSKAGSGLGGHFGRDKTVGAVTDTAYFDNIKEKVRLYCLTCPGCQAVSQGNKLQKGGDELRPVKVPMEVWQQIGIDLITCLKPTPEGHNTIVTAVDYSSKWVVAEALKGKDGVFVGQFIYDLMCRYGACRVYITDQGREFCNQVADCFHELTNTSHRITSPYHPQANGQVERQNRTTQESLQKCRMSQLAREAKDSLSVFRDELEAGYSERPDDWYLRLQSVVYAANTRRHASTGFTPFKLMFMRDPLQIWEQDDPFKGEGEEMSITETVHHMENLRAEMFDVKAANILKKQAHYKKHYDMRHARNVSWKVGDLVMKKNKQDEGRKAKNCIPYIGPYVVVGVSDRGGYYIESKAGTRLKNKFPASHLKNYHSRYDAKIPTHEEIAKLLQEEPLPAPLDLSTTYSPTDSPPASPETLPPPVHDDTDDKCLDLTITSSTPPEEIFFNPATLYVRRNTCAVFNMSTGKKDQGVPLSHMKNEGVGLLCPKWGPSKIATVKPDGNCLFRSFAHLVTGREENHAPFRFHICRFIRDPDNWDIIRPYMYGYYDENHKLVKYACATGEEYIEKSRMDQFTVWGTEVEIFVFTQMTKKDVVIYAKTQWVPFRYKGIGGRPTRHAYYLCNLTGTHFDAVHSVAKECTL